MITPLMQSYRFNIANQPNINTKTINFSGRISKFSNEEKEMAVSLYNNCKSYIGELLPVVKEKTEFILNLRKILSKKSGLKPSSQYSIECTYDNFSKISYNGINYTIKKDPESNKIVQIGEKIGDNNTRYYYVFSNKKNNAIESFHEYTMLNETFNASLLNGKVVYLSSNLKNFPAKYNIKLDFMGNIKNISTEGLFNDKKYIFDTKGRLINIIKPN